MSKNRQLADSLVVHNQINEHIPLSGVASYNLLSGAMVLSNSVITAGMATSLYTGNGTTQSVVTGVDMATQWGNSADETFGGLVWVKSRSGATDNLLQDTVRGITDFIVSNSTQAAGVNATLVTATSSSGFNIGNNAAINTNLATYASWNFQTTHRTSGTTNHGKAYTCHYNPFTGFTIVKYEGSGLAGHEIPHHLGRKLGFANVKHLSGASNWISSYRDGYFLQSNLTAAEQAGTDYFTTLGNDATILGTVVNVNAVAQSYILYGWANSYFDEANTLIGSYEVGIYQGTGAAGNKVQTRGKPAWLLTKRIDTTSLWVVRDNLRNDADLYPNLANSELATDSFDFNQDGFTLKNTSADINASGGQYLYMVVYDNDSGSGKSKYPRATDTSALNLNAVIPFANGLDNNGTKNTILTKNETVSGLTLTQGKNYVYAKNDGLYGVKAQAPQYGSYNGFGDYFDANTNKWYQSPSVSSSNFSVQDWFTTLGTATWTISNGSGTLNGDNGFVYKIIPTVIGKSYKVTLTVNSITVNTRFYSSTSGTPNGELSTYNTSSIGTFSYTFVAIGTSSYFSIDTNGAGMVTVDNFSVYPINNDGSVDTSSATPITESRNYLDAIVYADAGGQPTYVEQLPKIEYKKDMEVDTLKVLSGFDLNQKWYEVSASRVLGATYTNTSGKSITVNVSFEVHGGPTSGALYCGVHCISRLLINASDLLQSNQYTLTGDIPNGATYKVSNVLGTGDIIYSWTELR